MRAARIIHKKSEQTIYYEDARLEFAGVPIAYIPYFSGPDPTVKRKTGFLAPTFINTDALGYGVGCPISSISRRTTDLTLTPTFLSRQGVLGQAEWRHRLVNGSYKIRVSGIFQQDRKRRLPAGAARRGRQGFPRLVESTGRFFINPRWNFGWNVAG